MDDASVRVRVDKTLSKFPTLRRIYTSSFLDALVPDRQNLNNHLLLLLADTEDSFSSAFWSEVSDDLIALEDVGAFKVFGSKLRQRGRIELQSAKTELELPAWMRHKGYPIELEPLNPENGRRCEFAAETIPPTSWEVKSILDHHKVRDQEKMLAEVAKSLRYIDEPYVLHIEIEGLELGDVQEAVQSVLQKIKAFHRAGGQPIPIKFESHGLEVTISGRSAAPYGFTGTEISGPYWLGNEDIRRVLDRAIDATSQVPRSRAGIAVIDTTMATFIEPEDIQDACYGELTPMVVGGQMVQARTREAIFQPTMYQMISAVMHYERKNHGNVKMKVYHNPFADTRLPADLLRDKNVTQVKREQVSPTTYVLREFT
jgi:hypothetical protein